MSNDGSVRGRVPFMTMNMKIALKAVNSNELKGATTCKKRSTCSSSHLTIITIRVRRGRKICSVQASHVSKIEVKYRLTLT